MSSNCRLGLEHTSSQINFVLGFTAVLMFSGFEVDTKVTRTPTSLICLRIKFWKMAKSSLNTWSDSEHLHREKFQPQYGPQGWGSAAEHGQQPCQSWTPGSVRRIPYWPGCAPGDICWGDHTSHTLAHPVSPHLWGFWWQGLTENSKPPVGSSNVADTVIGGARCLSWPPAQLSSGGLVWSARVEKEWCSVSISNLWLVVTSSSIKYTASDNSRI